MKKYLFLLASIFISTSQIIAQSGVFSAVMSTGGGSSSNVRPRIALNSTKQPIIVWNKSSNKSVSMAIGTGSTFSAPLTLTPSGFQADVFDWAGQEICAYKDTIYVVYAGSNSNVYINKSVNGGATFSDTIRCTSIGSDKARFPTISINGNGKPAIAYMRMLFDYSVPRYVVENSMNGSTFMSDVDASKSLTGNDVCDCCPAALVCKNNQQALLFRDNNSNQRNIKGGLSGNGGTSFTTLCAPDENNWMIMSCPSTGPDGHFGIDSLYSVFASEASSPMKVFISATDPITQQVGSHRLVSSTVEDQNYPRIAGNRDTFGVVYEQFNKIFFTYTMNGIAGLSSILLVNDSTDDAIRPDIEYASGVFHIVWQSNSGMVHYRTYSLIGSTDIPQSIEVPTLTIFPNPSEKFWQITTKSPSQYNKVHLLNSVGQAIYSATVDATKPLDLQLNCNTLSQGIYYLILEKGSMRYYHKLIKL